jgi:signal transduction histidine kinase
MAPGSLDAVVAEAARLAGPQAAGHGVRVELSLAGDLPPVAMSAPALLQVFRNLTGNSLQAMPGGGVLRLQTRPDPKARVVEATVSDTGPGLPPEVRAHLFEPFFTTKPEGTGLGLPIAREIALAHRGELVASPGPDGRGAAFTLRLPVAASLD